MDNKLKILHIIGGGEFGGAEQHILTLMEEFQKDTSIDVQVITFYDAAFSKALREKGFSVIPFKEFGRFDLRIYPRLVELIQGIKPDIVHSHGVKANFFARLASTWAKVPHRVTTVHSFLEHDYSKAFPYFIANQMEKRTSFLCHHFAAVSNAIRHDLIERGISEKKISIIPNGIQVESYSPTPDLIQAGKNLRKAWNISNEAFVIGTTARLVPVKGLTYLLKGFALALQEEQALSLVVVGDGPQREYLLQLAKELKISENVRFVGFRKDVPKHLAAFDGYINTAISEGQSISLLEAMAAEKPAIVTGVGGMKEMVTDQESAIVIEPRSIEMIRDSILLLKQHEALRHRIRETAKQHLITHYSSTVMAEKLKRIYYQIVEGTL